MAFKDDISGQDVKFVINDTSGLDYYVGGKIKLRGLQSLVEKDGTIEIQGSSGDRKRHTYENMRPDDANTGKENFSCWKKREASSDHDEKTELEKKAGGRQEGKRQKKRMQGGGTAGRRIGGERGLRMTTVSDYA